MSKKVICLFDVDGTLTKPRNTITDHMLQFLIKLSSYVPLAVVSGSDFQKVSSQISPSAAEKFPFIFSENGLVVHSYGEKISSTNIVEHVGEDILQRLINFCLQYMSNLWLPRKRGNFIEFRDGLINICPVGRSCTQEERDEFADYDAVRIIFTHRRNRPSSSSAAFLVPKFPCFICIVFVPFLPNATSANDSLLLN
ncbi:Phosphomannomutase 2 isoform 1 [Schistosoma japonicum]|uniref:Phosphomannomutase n=1 Tax=Schistosoma japonicum TaxID=6182 RepID=A0A4Z2DHA8_SCHJA|nr:Phosphomannomutase 2 [Schistosoma japonicum]KAH8873963.1 Phosphomannomutase 2 [Schistosoma japonicum]TNN15798.1 Phosphomannomutase 2 isoform 1 [Schistosoma japonicum]